MRTAAEPTISTAHPRSRGEHLFCAENRAFTRGSSPLARGTLGFLGKVALCVRLIPARAGNTTAEPVHYRCQPAHPRSRGEHAALTCSTCSRTGSSPLARGTHPNTGGVFQSIWLIPARAGNTAGDPPTRGLGAAHPRSRGEHPESPCFLHRKNGSSPLARGTPEFRSTPALGFRLIPARAGNTFAPNRPATLSSAHPRSRGEHFSAFLRRVRARGSSPLARGTLDNILSARGQSRLIPARAGNTFASLYSTPSTSAHPRSRGEHFLRGL